MPFTQLFLLISRGKQASKQSSWPFKCLVLRLRARRVLNHPATSSWVQSVCLNSQAYKCLTLCYQLKKEGIFFSLKKKKSPSHLFMGMRWETSLLVLSLYSVLHFWTLQSKPPGLNFLCSAWWIIRHIIPIIANGSCVSNYYTRHLDASPQSYLRSSCSTSTRIICWDIVTFGGRWLWKFVK